MSILINQNTRLLVHGITGRQGMFHTEKMLAYGTNIVGGITPGKGGNWVHGIPVFDTAVKAVEATGANCSMISVPARFAAESIYEAADAGVPLIVCLTEGIPVLDMINVSAYLGNKSIRLVGPNCPGMITPGKNGDPKSGTKVGITPGSIVRPGNVGIVSRSGTLTYEVIFALTSRGIGQSTCIGIGGDPIIGTNFIDVLQMFEEDPGTDQVVLIGEIGGNDEQVAASYVSRSMSKPVTAFIAGQTAPPGRRMGHAGAIVEGASGTAEAKIKALEAVGVKVAQHPEQIVELMSL
ncbi:MAG TPA: succinate--CoA ligase subunit alpha [Patescibacteria group bacterium]|nr:succinate--CoA ligase subunit alpha [Patescibacteria group bacterium]